MSALLLLLTAACVGEPDTKDSEGPIDSAEPKSTEACGYTPMPDLDPAENVVEVTVIASQFAWDPGTGVPLETGMAFNDSVPGPVLEAKLGDTVKIHYTNNTDMETSLHWHGLRVTPEMDGIQQMMGDPVEPGESFEYEFTVVDSGFYWFHTHMDTATTIEAGLYAPIILHAPDELSPDCDMPVVLDDVLLDEGSLQIAPPDTDMMQLMGRLGNVLMANGRSDRRVSWQKGQTTLLRLVNASNARYWDLYLEGHSFTVVGTDGGFLAEPYTVDHLVMAPGERYMVVVEAVGEIGGEYRLMNRRFQLHEEDGDMIEPDPLGDGENPFMTFVYDRTQVTGTAWVQPAPDVPTWGAAVENLGHHWVLEEDMMGGTVTIDGQAWPNVPMVDVEMGVDTTFVVENKSEMHHPFHIHGNRFQVVDVGGAPVAEGQGWKDTFDIPPRTTVTLVSNLDNPGEWMYHCHILEHADDGMAGMMTVME
jgi:FtsP/CotA-like multicopper oxidase with cupredoxin domain